MENNMTLPAQPLQEEKPAFKPTKKQVIAVIVSYLAAYLYTYIFFFAEENTTYKIIFAVFVAMFCVGNELMHLNRRGSAESYIWLGCVVIMTVGFFVNGTAGVWDVYLIPLVHLFAVYYVCARSGQMAMGKSSMLIPADIINAYIVVPFKNFFFRIRTIWYGLTVRKDDKNAGVRAAFTIAAIVVGCVLLYIAGELLSSADDSFGEMIDGALNILSGEALELVMRFVFSLPIGAYLSGLIIGFAMEDKQGQEKTIAKSFENGLASIKKVPDTAWIVITAIFCVFYAVFFAIQARYLFGAFTHTLPEHFTVAQYARQGFFEMCRVMALNFVLLFLITRTGVKGGKGIKIAATVLLCASVLFAACAMSKLILYISCFGFTPLRLASSWLVFSLLSGCIFAGVNVWTDKKTFCPWLLLSAVTMAALALV